jgi:hypothetical protein
MLTGIEASRYFFMHNSITTSVTRTVPRADTRFPDNVLRKIPSGIHPERVDVEVQLWLGEFRVRIWNGNRGQES